MTTDLEARLTAGAAADLAAAQRKAKFYALPHPRLTGEIRERLIDGELARFAVATNGTGYRLADEPEVVAVLGTVAP